MRFEGGVSVIGSDYEWIFVPFMSCASVASGWFYGGWVP